MVQPVCHVYVWQLLAGHYDSLCRAVQESSCHSQKQHLGEMSQSHPGEDTLSNAMQTSVLREGGRACFPAKRACKCDLSIGAKVFCGHD